MEVLRLESNVTGAAANDTETSTAEETAMSHANGPAATAVIIVLYVCIHVLCLFGNALVLIIIIKHKKQKMRSKTNFFLANLAVADLMVALFCMGQHLLLQLVWEDWVFGDQLLGWSLCKVYGFVRSLSYFASTSILLLLAFERFLAIVHPFSSRTYLLSQSTLKWSALTVWLIAGLISTPNVYFFQTFTHEFMSLEDSTVRNQTICLRAYNLPGAHIPAYDFTCFVLYFLVPCITMGILYTFVGIKLRASTKTDLGVTDSNRHVFTRSSTVRSGSYPQDRPSPQGSGSSTHSWEMASQLPEFQALTSSSICSDPFQQSAVIQKRKKVIRMLVVIVIMFVVCWLPMHIRKLMFFLDGWDATSGQWLGQYFLPATDWLINLNSAINPLIYALFSENFRTAAMETLRCTTRSYLVTCAFGKHLFCANSTARLM
ncbi:putative Neuropeptide FF receptor 2 [Hypsibius exemplaris]|uniref:Neuropeptide FF receptor 2 n=1 Tax=Hypsibius exemplaris TaxID=2072580 RepID=A0A9X6RLI2_HYPEX|nr:putative Neuropeptide FF receptor 2 [Hypsibius exemplaris]